MQGQDNFNGQLLRPDVDFQKVRDGRRSPLFYFDVDLTNARSVAAGTAMPINVAGDSFYVDKNPLIVGPATVHFQDTTSGTAPAPVYCEPGFIAKVPFTQLLVENAAQPGMKFRFHYGVNIDFQPGASSSVNVNGVVSVIDGGFNRSNAGTSYWGTVNALAVAGQLSHVQLWCLPGSPKRVALKKLTLASSVTQDVNIGFNATALGGGGANMGTKLNGGASSGNTEVRNATSVASLLVATRMTLPLTALVPLQFTFDDPIILTPGSGFVFHGLVANNNVVANFEWFEI